MADELHYIYDDEIKELTERIHKGFASVAGAGLACFLSDAEQEKALAAGRKDLQDAVCSLAELAGLSGKLQPARLRSGEIELNGRLPLYIKHKTDKYKKALLRIEALGDEIRREVRNIQRVGAD